MICIVILQWHLNSCLPIPLAFFLLAPQIRLMTIVRIYKLYLFTYLVK